DYGRDLAGQGTRPGPFHLGDYVALRPGCAAEPSTLVTFDNTAVYSPVSYLPQSIGLAVARRLGAPVPVLFYAGRLAALLGYLGLVSLALRIAPVGRSVIMAVALMPMSLVLGTQYSADGVTIAFSLLLVGAVVHCRWDPRATWRSFLLAAAAAAALALCKSTYFVLAPLLLLVPTRLFPSSWSAHAARIGSLVIIALLAAGWYLQVRGNHPTGVIGGQGIDPGQQLVFIQHHWMWYGRFLLLTLFGPQTGYFTWPQFVSWVGFSRSPTAGLPSPPPLVMAAGVALLLVAYAREAPRAVVLSAGTIARAALPVALVAVNTVLLVTVLYATLQRVGDSTLWLQGRYLLPLAAAPVVSLLALGPPAERPRSVLPLAPLALLMFAYLVAKVPVYFYR
ncbi:MAG TPA: DUF2142 domain-containing protein, partial [Candidatus Eisenbacteria bacterium]|nr:DUF2142 domain-containing protein [Candidatus Eisenbacteria bacterium]